jgi:hypothetical protein
MPAHSASEDARERVYVAGIYVSCAARAYAVLFPILLRRKTVALKRDRTSSAHSCVMAGLVPAIHVFDPTRL